MRGVCPQKVLSDFQAFTPARTFVNPALQQAAGRCGQVLLHIINGTAVFFGRKYATLK